MILLSKVYYYVLRTPANDAADAITTIVIFTMRYVS
jgi:hypothetical protein